MINEFLMQGAGRPPTPKEGDLYREVTISGKTFQLIYGYYEDFERDDPFNEPMPIYPDFIKEPRYTSEGLPFVTAMQNVCKCYDGKHDEESSCSDCMFFQGCEELFGICNCPQNKQR